MTQTSYVSNRCWMILYISIDTTFIKCGSILLGLFFIDGNKILKLGDKDCRR